VIPLQRDELPPRLGKRLDDRAAKLRTGSGAARDAWRAAKTVRRDVKEQLEGMAPGLARCMYCGDSQGTDIDHFKPIALDSAVTFLWSNHFLACSHCNSNEKRDQYPCGPDGSCLLVDPCREDPYDHLRLTLTTGQYTGLTAKGEATIRVFGLARRTLERGRALAYIRCQSMLRDWLVHRQDVPEVARTVLESLQEQPFADVLHAMLRKADAPGAPKVFERPVLKALRTLRDEWELVPGSGAAGAPPAPRTVRAAS
jgi:uncharacterized protein (TIGR02646 family)